MTIDETEQPGTSDTSADETGSGQPRVPAAPYMSGKSFTNMLERYADEGLPDVFDTSFYGNISGSTIAQTRSTLRFFDLIDDHYVPTELFKDLVVMDERSRKGVLKSMVEDKYADALGLSMNATSGQLSKVFNERGISGATVDKAIGFYLHVLDYVGIPYSSHFKKRRSSASTGTRRRKPVKQETPAPTPPVTPPAKPKMTTEEEQRAAYVQTLLDLAKKDGTDGEAQERIFDRIEKALGIGAGVTTSSGSAGNMDLT